MPVRLVLATLAIEIDWAWFWKLGALVQNVHHHVRVGILPILPKGRDVDAAFSAEKELDYL